MFTINLSTLSDIHRRPDSLGVEYRGRYDEILADVREQSKRGTKKDQPRAAALD